MTPNPQSRANARTKEEVIVSLPKQPQLTSRPRHHADARCYRFFSDRKFCRIGVVGFFGVWPDWYGILSPNCRALIVFVMSGPGRRCSGCVVLRCERGFSAWPISHRTRSDRCGRKVLRQAAIVRPVLIRTLTTGSRFSIAANFLS